MAEKRGCWLPVRISGPALKGRGLVSLSRLASTARRRIPPGPPTLQPLSAAADISDRRGYQLLFLGGVVYVCVLGEGGVGG